MTLKKLQTTFLLFITSKTIDFFKETKMFMKCPRDYTRPRTKAEVVLPILHQFTNCQFNQLGLFPNSTYERKSNTKDWNQ